MNTAVELSGTPTLNEIEPFILLPLEEVRGSGILARWKEDDLWDDRTSKRRKPSDEGEADDWEEDEDDDWDEDDWDEDDWDEDEEDDGNA